MQPKDFYRSDPRRPYPDKVRAYADNGATVPLCLHGGERCPGECRNRAPLPRTRAWYSQSASVDPSRGASKLTPCSGFKRMYSVETGPFCGKILWDGTLKTAPDGCCKSRPPLLAQEPSYEWERFSYDPQYYGARTFIEPGGSPSWPRYYY